MGAGRALSRRRCGRGEPCPGADVGGASPVPAQLQHGRRLAPPRCSTPDSNRQVSVRVDNVHPLDTSGNSRSAGVFYLERMELFTLAAYASAALVVSAVAFYV